MGMADRGVRLIIVAVIAILYFMNIIQGTLAYVLLGVAGIFLLTSLINFCPLYTILGVKTSKK